MKRSSLLLCFALPAVAACSYYDTGLLKFSPEEADPRGGAGQGGASMGATGGVGAMAGAEAAGVAGAIGGGAGASGSQPGGGAGASGASAGASGASAGASGAAAGASGASAGASGAAGSAPAGASGAAGSAEPCVRATVPTRPIATGGAGGAGNGGAAGKAGASGAGGKAGAAGNAGGASGADPGVSRPDNIILAVRSLDFAEKVEPTVSTVGFDIDGSCTCGDVAGEVCKPWKPRSPLCDGPGGRDNSFPRLLQTLVTFGFAQSSQQLSQTLENGDFTLLLRIRNWNLTPNDPEVSVSFYTSSGTTKPPEWTGKDVWTVLSNSVENGSIDQPALEDTNAYVSDGNLVASLPTFDANDKKVLIQLNPRFGLALSGARIVGKLESLLGAYRIAGGTLSGTWRDRDFFAQVATVADPIDDKKTVCTDNFLYPQVKSGFCDIADLAGNAADLSGVCASSSIAMSFSAQEARMAGIEELPPANTSTCAAAVNPAQDGCAKP